jgi:hypothetical protein
VIDQASSYEPRPIKRHRRTAAEIDHLMVQIYQVVESDPPMSVRQVFYRLVSIGAIDKTEHAYKNVVVRLLGKMRREGLLPFGWIADNTRWIRKPTTYSSLEAALHATAATYRRSVWYDAEVHVEVWVEKEALAGVIYGVTGEWDVPLVPLRGYSSISLLHSVAEEIQALGKPAYIYYFGDRDPSGVDIDRVAEKDVRQFASAVEIHFERMAVLPSQIVSLNLPSRPTKKTDSRNRGFAGESVELDSIPPGQLRALVRMCIERHVDPRQLEQIQRVEESERGLLRHIAKHWDAA